jgi:Mn2+/Fe2+ NRAMP family transporter
LKLNEAIFSSLKHQGEVVMEKKGKFGPGFLVAAAFIGPGTVTTATLAGATYGYRLIWVILLSTLAAITLQEMAGRFSLSTRMDVATALATLTKNKWVRLSLQILAFLAIIIGCTAYEAGNIIGGGLGLEIITGQKIYFWVLGISIIAAILLWQRNYELIEKFLITLVVIMGISFFITALMVKPQLSSIFKGFLPKIPKNSILLILGLLGTTVVPYNIFLHSSVILKKWRGKDDISIMRKDTMLSIGLGGLITISIVVTAASAYFLKGISIKSPSDLSLQLAPLYGDLAKWFFGIGLFSAGLSSAITAPYAAAWTAKGLFGWRETDWKFRMIFLFVISFGVMVSILAIRPLHMIVVAQVTNALLLPIVAIFIVYLLNKDEAGEHKNVLFQNLLFIIVFLIIVIINLKYFV